MLYFQVLAKRLILPIIALSVLFGFYSTQSALLVRWNLQLTWLTASLLVVSSMIAMQFGRSRLVLCCLLLGALLAMQLEYIPSPDAKQHLWLPLCTLVTWLMWRKDKGFRLVNIITPIIEAMLIGLPLWFFASDIIVMSAPVTAPVYELIYQVSPALSNIISPFELLVFLLLIAISLIRVAIRSDNNHIGIFLTLLLLLSNQLLQSTLLLTLSVFILALFYIVAVLIDSFNMAFRDELTGIPSRRALMQFKQTLGRKYVLVMADIDHFKKFNDTYGHDVGDQVLKLVASQLNKVTGGGKAFRYGGEEFTLIFPRKNVHDVLPHLEALRAGIANYPIVLRGQDRPKHPPKKTTAKGKKPVKQKTVNVSCSFGVAERSADRSEFDTIMKQADVALYAAKKAGRNCVKQA